MAADNPLTPEERRRIHTRRRNQKVRARRAARTEDQIIRDRLTRWPAGKKRCSACGQERPFHAFPENSHVRDGLFSKCYPCLAKPGAHNSVAQAAMEATTK